MEQIYHEFDKMRLLIFNLRMEIDICKSFYYDYMIFLNAISHRPEFAPLHELATTRRLPVRVADGRQNADGSWHSDTFLLLTKVKYAMITLFEYAPRVYQYIIALWRETDALVRGLENYRGTFYFYLQHSIVSSLPICLPVASAGHLT